MPYANETSIYKAPWWATGEVSSGASNEDAALNFEWPLSLIHQALAGAAMDCTLLSGFAVSAGAGLSISVAAGSGSIGGLCIYAAGATAKAGLTDNASLYIFLKKTATTKRDRSFTVEFSASAPPMADAIYIASVTTAGGAVTNVNNDPTGRAPRLASLTGLPGLHVVAPAGAEYSDPKTAIEAAHAGDVIFITAGTYNIASTITFPANNIAILGTSRDGAVLNFTTADANHCINANGKDGWMMSNLTVQAVSSKTGDGVLATGCTNVYLQNVKITGANLYAAFYSASGSDRTRLMNCWFDGGGQSIVLFGPDIRMHDCHITSALATGGGDAVWIGSLRGRVERNTILMSGTSCSRIALSLDSANDMLAQSNHICYTSAATGAVGIRLTGWAGTWSRMNAFSNTIILTGVTGVGIQLWTGGATPNLDDCIVNDNSVFNAATGIYLVGANVRYARVHDNQVVRTNTAAVTDSSTSANLADNT